MVKKSLTKLATGIDAQEKGLVVIGMSAREFEPKDPNDFPEDKFAQNYIDQAIPCASVNVEEKATHYLVLTHVGKKGPMSLLSDGYPLTQISAYYAPKNSLTD